MSKFQCFSGNGIDPTPPGDGSMFDFSRMQEILRQAQLLRGDSWIGIRESKGGKRSWSPNSINLYSIFKGEQLVHVIKHEPEMHGPKIRLDYLRRLGKTSDSKQLGLIEIHDEYGRFIGYPMGTAISSCEAALGREPLQFDLLVNGFQP